MALPAAAWRLIVAFVVVFATYSAVKSFLYLQVNTSTAVNDLCTNDALLNYEEGQLTWNGVTMDAADWRDLCTLPSQLQFDRFLWFVSDGFPVSFAFPLLEVFEDHGVGYTIEIPGAKYSHAIYTSFLTGQPPTNYKGMVSHIECCRIWLIFCLCRRAYCWRFVVGFDEACQTNHNWVSSLLRRTRVVVLGSHCHQLQPIL